MKRSTLIFLCILAVFSLACGLLDDEATNITYREEVPLSFTINANLLCPGGDDVDCTTPSATAPRDVELSPIEFDLKVDIVELTGNEKLADAAGKFRSIEITSIDYAVESNGLNFELPPMDIYLGPLTATSRSAQSVFKLTTIPAVPAGEDVSGTAPVEQASADATSSLFKTLKFTAIPYAQPTIREGEPFPPSGTARMSITFNVKLVANPVDAL